MVTTWDQRPAAPPILQQQRYAIIGANIRALRQRNGWTQARLGQIATGKRGREIDARQAKVLLEVLQWARQHPHP